MIPLSTDYDAYGNILTSTIPLVDSASGLVSNPITEGVSPSVIGSGQLSSELGMVGGHLQSSDYVTGVTGWRLDPDSVEFGSGYFRGDITGATGTFSGALTGGSLNIPDLVTANSFHVDSLGNTWWGATVIGSAVAKILNTGELTATLGSIGGWSVGATSLSAVGGTSSSTNTAATSPGTMADDATVGTVAWVDPNYSKVADTSYSQASAILDPGTFQSHYLKATNFGFIIPTGATINGILVEFRKSKFAGSADTKDVEVKIVKSNGTIGTTNKADSATDWSTTFSYVSYGASDNLWGETWTAEDINDVDFGVVMSANITQVAIARVDHIRITVYYTTAPTAGSVGMSSASTGVDDVRFWAGGTTPSTAPARIYGSGAATFTSITATGAITTGAGSSIDGQYLSALSVTTGALNNLAVTAAKIDNATITSAQIANATITGSNIVAGTIASSNIKDATIVGGDIAAGTIAGSNIGSATITGTNIGAATIAGSNIALATVTGSNIVAGTITASRIKDATITATQIANATIAGANIASGTIQAGNIANATITATQISGTAGITGGQIASATIIATNIGANTILGSNVAAGTITASRISNGTITANQIALGAITGSVIAANTIAASNLVNNTITANQIANATITGSQIAATTIAGSNLVNNTITATQIQNATITGTQVASATITGSNIVAGTIASSNIKDATITSGDIASATIVGSNIALATVTGSNIVAGAITASRIASATITGDKIASATITGSSIVSGAITASRISNLTITAGQIANLSINDGKISDVGVSKLTAGSITSKAITLAIAGGTGDSYIAGGNALDFTNWYGGDANGGAVMLGLDDSDSDKGKFFAGNYSTGQYLRFDGSLVSGVGSLVSDKINVMIASDTLYTSADTERAVIGGTYTKIKEIRTAIAGTVRVKFDLKIADTGGGSQSYGKIYKNGVAFGTERINATTSYVTYSEDLTFAAGDLIQLYIKENVGSYDAYAQNFRIYYTVTSQAITTVNTD